MRRVHVIVRGKVQGVFFRESTRRRALELGVHGFVRNLSDGTVEAVAQGDDAAIADFLAFCRSGPPAANVTDVSVSDKPVGSDLGPFVVER